MIAFQLLALALCGTPQDEPTRVPKLSECRLVLGDKQLAPSSSADGPRFGPAQSGWEIATTEKEVRFRRVGVKEAGTSIAAPVELTLEAVAGDVAWFVEQVWSWEPNTRKPEVHRLDLGHGVWLPVQVLDDKALRLEPPAQKDSWVTSVLIDKEKAYVVRASPGVAGTADAGEYVVAGLDPASLKCSWAHRYPLVPAPSLSGAVISVPLLALPSFASPSELGNFGSDLLVCVDGARSILELDTQRGTTIWEVDRLWEYQRGYIDMSIWSHFLDRFGVRRSQSAEERSAEVSERRKLFESAFAGSVAAGPFVIDRPGNGQGTDRGMLVIVELTPRNPTGNYVGQQFAYEITADGRPVSVVALPRVVLGWTACTVGDHVVFACQNGAFVCIASTRNQGYPTDSPGRTPDAAGCIRWYRELRPSSHAAWMECDPAGDPVALGELLGIRCAGGGWIKEKGDTLFHFPLWILDPRDGSASEAELRVPFGGELPVPTGNYSGRPDAMHTTGAYGLALTQLRIDGDRLIVLLANPNQVWQLEFDARELLPAK